MNNAVVYFDGGGSGIRAAASINGNRVTQKEFLGITPGEGQLVNYLAEIVISFAKQVNLEVRKAVLAVATLPKNRESYKSIAQLVFQSTQLKEIWICSDSVSSCAAVIERDGVVITAGTGITALAVGKSGKYIHTLSGDGHLIADTASAYWIGRMGLSYATRASDGRDQSTGAAKLLEVACNEFKTDPYHLPHVVHQSDRAVNAVAQFAKQVNDLAAGGNEVALKIIDMAGDEIASIASTAKRVCEGGKDFQATLLGGVLADHTMTYKNSVKKIEKLGIVVNKSNKTPLDGAHVLANQETPGVYASLIQIFRAVQS
jgi:N-acetylglucosamine kinase-like BadF-type ATPase